MSSPLDLFASRALPHVASASTPRSPSASLPPSSSAAGVVLRLTIPGQPVGKGRPRFSRRSGHTYTPEKTASAEDVVRRLARAAGFRPLEGRLAIRVRFFCDTVRGDVDNFVKLLTDGLNGIAYADDRQIDVISARREFDWERPRTELEIERIGDEPVRPRKKRARLGGVRS